MRFAINLALTLCRRRGYLCEARSLTACTPQFLAPSSGQDSGAFRNRRRQPRNKKALVIGPPPNGGISKIRHRLTLHVFQVLSGVLRQSQDNFFRSSRTVDLSQACAASVCILGCQVIRSFKEPRTEGASRILIARALFFPLLGRNYMMRRSTVRITRVAIAMAPIDMR